MGVRLTLILSLIGAMLFALSSSASSTKTKEGVTPVGPAPHVLQHAKPFSKMSLSEVEKHQEKALAHYLYVSRFFIRWRKKNLVGRPILSARSALTGLKHCQATGIIEPKNYCWYASAARWTARELARTKVKIAERANSWVEFSCIHSNEGSTNANTGNGYYGGLQMDLSFQQTYGAEFLARWGTADKWPVWAQVEAARRARDGYGGYGARGYEPWPETARTCGQL